MKNENENEKVNEMKMKMKNEKEKKTRRYKIYKDFLNKYKQTFTPPIPYNPLYTCPPQTQWCGSETCINNSNEKSSRVPML